MQRGDRVGLERATLRRLARQIRQQDPELARMLSGRDRWAVPRPRFTAIPTLGYAVVSAVLLLSGLVLAVGSAVFWGLVVAAAAVLRHHAGRPGPAPAGRGTERGPSDRSSSL